MSLYFSLDDRTVEKLSVDFPIQDFIDSLWYHLGRPFPLDGGDFWNKVIYDASYGKASLSADQRKHLKLWIEENKFYITQNFSKRAKVTLTQRLELL